MAHAVVIGGVLIDLVDPHAMMVIGFKLPMMLVRLFTLVEVLDRNGFRAEMPEMIASQVAAFPRNAFTQGGIVAPGDPERRYRASCWEPRGPAKSRVA